MKRIYLRLAIAIALTWTGAASAQGKKPLPQRTIAETLDSWIANTEDHAVPVADAMPEEKYSFAPSTTIGEYKDVRTFAQQVKHLAANNYWMAALIMGATPTADMSGETGPDSVRTKAQIMAYLKGSFAALHRAISTIDPANVVAPMRTPSTWQKTRLSFAIDAVAHSFDHYGQLVEYLRMNNIIPPDSRPGPSQASADQGNKTRTIEVYIDNHSPRDAPECHTPTMIRTICPRTIGLPTPIPARGSPVTVPWTQTALIDATF